MSSSLDKASDNSALRIAESRHKMITHCIIAACIALAIATVFALAIYHDGQVNQNEHEERMETVQICKQSTDPVRCAADMRDALDD